MHRGSPLSRTCSHHAGQFWLKGKVLLSAVLEHTEHCAAVAQRAYSRRAGRHGGRHAAGAVGRRRQRAGAEHKFGAAAGRRRNGRPPEGRTGGAAARAGGKRAAATAVPPEVGMCADCAGRGPHLLTHPTSTCCIPEGSHSATLSPSHAWSLRCAVHSMTSSQARYFGVPGGSCCASYNAHFQASMSTRQACLLD